jgi:predicted nuclease of restriction endonuclease-like (RecB) superfamily
MNSKKPRTRAVAPAVAADEGGGALYGPIREILLGARQRSYRAVNVAMVEAYWRIGQRIVEHEQGGAQRAAYGERVLLSVGERLTREFGKGYNAVSLRNYRQFHLTFSEGEIRSALRSELTWTHYRALMRVESADARKWYLREATEQGWSTRALERQIGTLHYERLLSSQDKAVVQAEAGALIQAQAAPDPRDFIRDPYVLEFLGAQPGAALYEKDVEQGLLDQLHKFLLELGKGFDMYVRVFDGQMRQSGDNPTLGLILCSERNEAVARYSLLADSEQLFASHYRLWLPTEEELKAELERDRALIEAARAGEGSA